MTAAGVAFAGLDGCRSGWVLAVVGPTRPSADPAAEVSSRWRDLVLKSGEGRDRDADSDRSRAAVRISWHRTLGAAVSVAERAGCRGIGIDMPIGLPTDGRRPADDAARTLLGRRRSTLFPTPARPVLAARDFSEALIASRAATGKGISIQAWNLVPKIREVDAWVNPGHRDRVFEVHPELAFARLAGGVVLPEPKRTPAGSARRLALLDQRLGLGPAGLAELRHRRPGPGMGLDDVLDALAVACSCERLMTGVGTVLGGGERDERDLPMRICY
ncbi:MAG: DUF429 domain-containing protein [Acidimicrobiales bacterium]